MRQTTEHQLLRIVRLLAWCAPLALVMYVIVRNIAPFGVTTITYDVEHTQGAITNLRPQGRILGRTYNIENKEYTQRMVIDPVYFDLYLPRNFNKATVALTYKNDKHPIIELGGRVSKDAFQFDLRPLENKWLEDLDELEWRIEKEDGVLFAQRPLEMRDQEEPEDSVMKEGTTYTYAYNNLGDFLNKYNGNDGNLATYNYNFYKLNKIFDYKPRAEPYTLEVPLRGKYDMLVYAEQGESVALDFVVEDLNLERGSDEVNVTIKRRGRIIADEKLVDDGERGAIKRSVGAQQLHIAAEATETGYYHIALAASDDIFTKRVVARQENLLFINGLYLAGNKAYQEFMPDLHVGETNFYMRGGDVLEATINEPQQAQQIIVNGSPLAIQQDKKKYAMYLNPSTTSSVRILNNDILLGTDGYISFLKESLEHLPLEVEVVGSNLSFRSSMDDYNYIIARYEPVTILDELKGWKQATAVFELGKLAKDGRRVEFLISAPGLDQLHNEIVIREIAVTLTADQLTPGVIWRKIKSLVQ